MTGLYPYTAEDIARQYTIEHGREGTTRQKPIPPDVWAALALGRIADALEALMPQVPRQHSREEAAREEDADGRG